MNPRRHPVLKHSAEYEKLRHASTLVEESVGLQSRYASLEGYFEEALDEQYGIIRNVITNDEYPEGLVIRDATAALENLPLENLYRIREKRLMLRALRRLRAIDYVLQKKSEEGVDVSDLRGRLMAHLNDLNKFVFDAMKSIQTEYPEKSTENQLEIHKMKLKVREDQSDEILVQMLKKAGLAKDRVTSDDYKKLLMYYEYLSTKINPASIVRTVTFDEKNAVVTRRTGNKTVDTPISNTEKSQAMQLADKYFDTLDVRTQDNVSEEVFGSNEFPDLENPMLCRVVISKILEGWKRKSHKRTPSPISKIINKDEDIDEHEHNRTVLTAEKERFNQEVKNCYPELKSCGEKINLSLDEIMKQRIPAEDSHELILALKCATRIAKGEPIDLADDNNPISELDQIRKKLEKKNRYKQFVARLFLFIGVALLVTAIVASVLFAPAAVVGIPLAIITAKILAAALAGSLSVYFSVKAIKKEWKHEQSPLKLFSDQLGEFTKLALVNVPFKPDFFIEYCANSKVPLHQEIAAFRDKIVYTSGQITEILSKNKNDLNRDNDFQKNLPKLLPEDLSEKEKNEVSNVLLATRVDIAQGGATNTGSLLFGSYFCSFALEGTPSSRLSTISDIKKTDHGYIIESVLRPDKYSVAPPNFIEIKDPFEYREKYHLKKVGDNWELTLKANSLTINPQLWKIILGKAIDRVNAGHNFTNDDLFVFVPCLKDADFATSFSKKLKNNSKLIAPEQYSFLKNLISANYGERWPVHLKELKTTIESNSPKPESQTRRLIM